MTSFAAGSTYSKAKFRFLLAIWCARRHRPFSVVEDPEFHQIIQMMYSRADIPSRISVSRDIQHLLEASRERLVSLLLVRLCRTRCLSCLFVDQNVSTGTPGEDPSVR